jgi:signal transduction histidine kinase
MRATNATHGSVLVARLDVGFFERRSLRGYAPDLVERAYAVPLPLNQGISGQVYHSKQLIRVDDVQADPHYFALVPTTRSELVVPIMRGDQVLGNLDLQGPDVGAFQQVDLDLLRMLTDQVAIALDNARLFSAEQEQRGLAEALAEAAMTVNSTLNFDQLLDRILEQVERVVAGDAFNIMLTAGENTHVVRWRGYEDTDYEIPIDPLPITHFPPLVKALLRKGPLIVPNTAQDPDWVALKGQEWLRSYVVAPIQSGGEIVGFLNVEGKRPGQFTFADARRLDAFANYVAIAFDNARLYRELREYAERLEERVRERTAEIQAQYARLDAILHSTSDGIVVADATGNISMINPVVQNWMMQTLSPADAKKLEQAIKDLAKQTSGQPDTVLELKGLDLQLNAAPIMQAMVGESVIAVHDVSQLKALDRLKSRLVSNVSHELRTPITAIKLHLALLRRASLQKRDGHLNALEREASHLAQLLEDILQLSRVDAGRLEMKPKPVSLNELIEIVVANRQVLAQNRGLTLEHQLIGPPPVALVDVDQVEQVLNNLIVNALYYTLTGGKVVVSTAQQQADGRSWAVMTVKDTGIGISEEELPHVFDRFFRGEEPQRMQLPGTGLGLSIVKEIVELHGGQITIESQIGVGTTATVWLPFAEKRNR